MMTKSWSCSTSTTRAPWHLKKNIYIRRESSPEATSPHANGCTPFSLSSTTLTRCGATPSGNGNSPSSASTTSNGTTRFPMDPTRSCGVNTWPCRLWRLGLPQTTGRPSNWPCRLGLRLSPGNCPWRRIRHNWPRQVLWPSRWKWRSQILWPSSTAPLKWMTLLWRRGILWKPKKFLDTLQTMRLT